jgi:predicted ATPase
MTSGRGLGQGRAGVAAPLLERDVELGQFAQLMRGTEDETRMAIVEGPAGIGKSRLIAELRELGAGEGHRVLMSVGSDLERDFPFGVVRQLFEPVLSDQDTRARLLEGAAGSARSVFELLGTVPDGEAAIEGDGSFAALHGLYWLTVNLTADGPLMLIIDDLHWCDRPSLRFLAYLSRRLDGLGAVVVAGLRTAEPGTDPVLLGEIVSNPEALHIHPGPLSDEGVTEMVRARLGSEPDAAFVTACRSATGGNPLLLRQLLSSLEADGRSPCWAVTPSCRWWRRSAGSRSRRWRGPRRPSRGPRSCDPSRRSASCTRSSATPSTTSCRPGSASCCTPPPRSC